MILSVLLHAAAAAAVQPGPAAPDPCAGDPKCVRVSAEQLFAAVDRLAGSGQTAEAEDLLRALTQDRNPDYRAEARFRLAVLREALGDRTGAIDWLQALLAEKPDAARARLELGRLLAAEGKTSEARRELQRAQAAGLPADVARTVGRFSSLLSATKRRGGSVEITAGPDSNVNRATGSAFVDTIIAPFELDADARRQGGFGAAGAVQIYSRDSLGGVTLLTRGALRKDLFAGKSRFNDIQIYAGSGPEFQTKAGRIRPALTVERRWFGGDSYSRGLGGALSWIVQPSAKSQLELEGSLVRQAISDNDVLDGTRYSAAATWDQALSSDTVVRLSLRGAILSVKEDAESLNQAGAEAIVAHDLGFGNLFGNVGYSALRGQARLQLFGTTREDHRLDLGAGFVARRNWSGFAPLLRVTHTRSRSNIAIFDFKRTRLDLGFSREF